MSVLTVTNTVPDRAFIIHEAPLTNSSNNRVLPQIPAPAIAELPSYTRAIAQKTQPGAANTHRHSRSTSSSTVPTHSLAPPTAPQPAKRHSYTPPASTPTPPSFSRPPSKSPSLPSNNNNNMQRQSTTGSNSNASLPRRSTSGRSVATNSPTSYVVLMRKQKATVWCDRSQNIDPRIAAQQKAAKQRAVLEVVGTNSQRTSTISSSGVVGKIRHHGVPKAGQYNPPNMSGAGVPTRLLEFDLLGEDDGTESQQRGRVTGDNSMAHARTGSGKSSINSAKYRSGYPRAHTTSPPDGGSPAHEGIPEAGETPGISEQHKENYFDSKKNTMTTAMQQSDSEEDGFGELREMMGPSAVQRAQEQQAKLEELRRRGSVDERTTTMSGQTKLYVTNPDHNNES